jgi:hypothetical protein
VRIETEVMGGIGVKSVVNHWRTILHLSLRAGWLAKSAELTDRRRFGTPAIARFAGLAISEDAHADLFLVWCILGFSVAYSTFRAHVPR